MSQALKRQTLVGLGLGPGLSPLLKAGPQARPGGFSGLGPLSINPKKYYFHPNFLQVNISAYGQNAWKIEIMKMLP